ncbi:response regulator [Myxococcota bacterium]|nr:response regulator [Myxococcota bacterium]
MSEQSTARSAQGPHPGEEIFVVDDDERFAGRLARAFRDRGFGVRVAHSHGQAIAMAKQVPITWAVVDLKLPDESGLQVIHDLCALHPKVQIVMLTGYGSVTTAVDAGRLGAIHYLAKPTDADVVLAAFGHADPLHSAVDPEDYEAPSLARVEWEHIQRVLAECDGNISEAARRLGLHRRTLQRKLNSLPPPR